MNQSLRSKKKGDIAFASIDFRILKEESGTRKVNGTEIPTTFGDINYYFGYSDDKEIIIAKWDKGEETIYFRGYEDRIRTDNYNKLIIAKKEDSISYSLNDKVIFKQRFNKLMGNGFGFSNAPNSKLWIDYVKIIN